MFAMGLAPQTLFYVAKLGIFGSYLGGSKTVGDLDVAIEVRYLFEGEDREARAARVLARTAEMGEDFQNATMAEAFLRDKLMSLLSWNSHILDFEPYEEVASCGCDIFTLVNADDPGAKGQPIRELIEQARAA